MSKKIDDSSLMGRYKGVLDVLEKNLRYIEFVGADPSLVADYKKVVSHLRAKTLVEVSHVLGGYGSKRKQTSDVDRDNFAQMSLKEIRERIGSPKTTRGVMEGIAAARFGMSKGGLSSLRSREALKEKIESLLSNESAHEVISQVVIGGGDDDVNKK